MPTKATLEDRLLLAENRLAYARGDADLQRQSHLTLQRRVAELEAENALLKRALAMLTRSLEDAEAESTR